LNQALRCRRAEEEEEGEREEVREGRVRRSSVHSSRWHRRGSVRRKDRDEACEEERGGGRSD
jgi:hypothetical protein